MFEARPCCRSATGSGAQPRVRPECFGLRIAHRMAQRGGVGHAAVHGQAPPSDRWVAFQNGIAPRAWTRTSSPNCLMRPSSVGLSLAPGSVCAGTRIGLWSAPLLQRVTARSCEEAVQDLLGPLQFGVPDDAGHGHQVVPNQAPVRVPHDGFQVAPAAGARWFSTADGLLDYAEQYLGRPSVSLHSDDLLALHTPVADLRGESCATTCCPGRWKTWACQP